MSKRRWYFWFRHRVWRNYESDRFCSQVFGRTNQFGWSKPYFHGELLIRVHILTSGLSSTGPSLMSIITLCAVYHASDFLKCTYSYVWRASCRTVAIRLPRSRFGPASNERVPVMGHLWMHVSRRAFPTLYHECVHRCCGKLCERSIEHLLYIVRQAVLYAHHQLRYSRLPASTLTSNGCVASYY